MHLFCWTAAENPNYSFYNPQSTSSFESQQIQNFESLETGKNLGGLLTHVPHFPKMKTETKN